jgi:hypothetical protein
LETGRKAPREASFTGRRIVCLLCTTLGRPELADLSTTERKEARDWLRRMLTIELMQRITGARNDWTIRAIAKDRVHDFDPPFDIEAFFGAQPLLQRVFAVLCSVELQYSHENVTILWASVADFDGDTLALYNEAETDGYKQNRYYPQQFDETSGLPICLEAQEDSQSYLHMWQYDSFPRVEQ